MRVPTDRPLDAWIRELMDEGRPYAFYQSPEWRRLRADVLADHHGECEMCEAEGKYGRAVTVHHEHEVRDEPSLALTRYLRQADGSLREVLHPLCDHHHNLVHGRTYDQLRAKRKTRKDARSDLRGEIW